MIKKCIFCGGSGKKSKEHIWPVWMHELLPILGDGGNISEVNTFRWHDKTVTKRSEKQGYLFTKKLRVVCGACNSGWMSEIESKVKPILEQILKNQRFDLTKNAQDILARWISMKVIVGEHAEKDTHVTPFGDRNKLMVNGVIPNYFCIYVGAHNEKHNSAWLRVSQTIILSKEGPSPPLRSRKRNAQSTAIIIGPLFVFLIAIRQDGIDATEFVRFSKIERLFPSKADIIKWPPRGILNSSDMGLAAYALNYIKNLPNVTYGGDLP